MSDGIGLAEALLGLDGFRVLEVHESPDELVIGVETTATIAWCAACGARAEVHDRMPIEIRDLPCFGRPARLVWRKRRWRCREHACDAKTWTERSEHVDAQRIITRRAGREACRQVGEHARPVSKVADEFGVCWWTVMNAVVEHGTPLVDDPDRVGTVRQLGIDETSFLAATREHATVYATGLVDLKRHIVIDMVEGNRAADLRRWTANADPRWLAQIKVVATDLTEHFRAGLSPHLAHARRVADPFHVVRVGNRCLDTVRRRVQNETLGHRGRKHDPLYRIRKILLTGNERLDNRGRQRMLLGLRVGDPNDEVLGAWLAKESVRDVYLANSWRDARLVLDKTIAGCLADNVPEIRSLGNTLQKWRSEILAHHSTSASNGPTEGLNLCVKKVKRCGHGFRSFEHYRLRVLLHAGGVTWPARPHPPRIRTRAPHSSA
ncbi:MAG TPA: ISL3 family transposase [Acidimicrobiia bacterium]|nr:ISL3 family transposase [Acidimicrobiia bacterium]